MRHRCLPLLLCTLAVSCAGASGSASGAPPRSSADVIPAAELRPFDTYSAYDAVNRLRPQWLRSRVPGQDPVVFMNGSELGGPEALRSVQVSTLVEIRFRNGRDATTRYGTGYGGGAIEMVSQRRAGLSAPSETPS
ncbi:MAG: hypothetical protein RQ751_01290 [Longimicrobiales bacterium]|nr:hypothetical protein [Longimicrobiales bacterium]